VLPGQLFVGYAVRLKVPRSILKPASKLRTWRVSLLRQRAQYLGMVEAPDEKAAEAAAVAQFDLNDEQRRRLARCGRSRDGAIPEKYVQFASVQPSRLPASNSSAWAVGPEGESADHVGGALFPSGAS
jgi:hypothetical protein